MPALVKEMALLMATLTHADINTSPREFQCLARNVYHEARGESLEGQIAVAQVTLNRVAHWRYPDTICEVVHQDTGSKSYDCQFSWTCDGLPDQPTEMKAYALATLLAGEVLLDAPENYAGTAMHYVAESALDRVWVKRMKVHGKIGRHVFLIEGDT